MPDDQSVQWPTDTVAESILQYIEMYKINAVVTFDKYGVSRHKNHISLYFAIAALCIEKKVPPCQYRSLASWHTNTVGLYNKSDRLPDCKLYVLESVNIIRKYIQLLDLPISLLSASYWYLVTYEQKRTIKVNWNILPRYGKIINHSFNAANLFPNSYLSLAECHGCTQVPVCVVSKVVHDLFAIHVHQYPPRSKCPRPGAGPPVR